jgi:alcohol dehydrogenase (cytochrome c)
MFRYLLCAGFTLVALTAQEEHGYTTADIERGGQMFLIGCANCHGPEGEALPDVKLASGRFRRGSSDADLVKIIRGGIPGTPMPPGNYTEAQAQMLVAYLRSMSRIATTGRLTAGITENPSRGKTIVEGSGQCLNCHRIAGQGGFLGPDLSDVGATRRRTDIERALVDPSAEIRVDNHTVRIVGRDGKEIQARLLNQDTYSLQGIDTAGKLVSVQKTSLRQFEVLKGSPMPSYKTKFSTQELADVTAYLTTLKGGPSPVAQVSFERILRASQEPQNWLTYSGNLNGQRYSPLTQINPGNVKNLELQWVMQTRAPAEPASKYEATSIVADGILYTVQPPNVVVALDAATGRIFWTYPYQPAASARLCCGRINRGLAILGNTLFMGTIDGNLMAIDARDGHPLWSTPLGDPEHGYSVTVAPLVVKKNIIAGTAGGEYGIRGSLSAFDAATGKEVWRFNTIPGPGEPGHETWKGDAWKQGGGSIWTTGSYDPELNLIYWGIGNPGPDWNGDVRPGDNLYTSSVVALDADTGKLKWHFQFTPHDEFDFDATQVPVVADIPWKGGTRKVLLFANRNGFFYVLDRATGEFLLGKPFVKVTWTSGLDAKGRPMAVKAPTPEGTLVYPENQGGTNWYNPSYSPRTGLFYVPCWMDTYATYYKRADTYRAGSQYTGGGATHDIPAVRAGAINRRSPELGYGAIQAIDPQTGDVKWQFKMSDVTDSGVLSTASDLVFAGGREGFFYALDARTGAPLWKAMVGGQISAGPVTYMVGQTQYVSIPSGNAVFTFALRR